ncbi:MAG: MotA/TolQ/ExbB proton channel family protein [Eubacteriales bacterium]|nr:MotA/TolQ/ExbB proton channel family protein [Eubacteriales bacterium]
MNTSLSNMTSGMLRLIVSEMQTPVVIVLLVLMAITLVTLGSFLCELFTEHRTFREDVPHLIEILHAGGKAKAEDIIASSGLLKRQKTVLKKFISAGDMPEASRQAYGEQLLFDEEEHYHRFLRWPETIMRLGPMFGLLGTLVPLGPGLMALGKGDTAVLSKSLLIAFDTTAAGVVIAAVAFVIYQIRKNWYKCYAESLESVMEVLMDQSGEEAEAEDA